MPVYDGVRILAMDPYAGDFTDLSSQWFPIAKDGVPAASANTRFRLSDLNFTGTDSNPFTWSVLNILSAPDGSEVAGDSFLVASSGASGAFTGEENHIATWDGASWTFETATIGDFLYNVANDLVYKLTTGGWVIVGKASIHQGGDTYGVPIKIGAKDAKRLQLITNNIVRIVIGSAGAITFNPLAGTGDELMGLDSSGTASRVSLDTNTMALSAGVLSSKNFFNADLTATGDRNHSMASSNLKVLNANRYYWNTASTEFGDGASIDMRGTSGGSLFTLAEDAGVYHANISIYSLDDTNTWVQLAAQKTGAAGLVPTVRVQSNAQTWPILIQGKITASSYGAGTVTGTATYALAVDAAHHVIEVPLASGSTPTWQATLLTTGGSTLTQLNTIAGGGFGFAFMNASYFQFEAKGTNAQFQILNSTGMPWMVFKNDVGETVTPTNGAMISGSWGGGAIKFFNQSSGGTPSLQPGVIDNSNNFTAFMIMATGGYGGNQFTRRIQVLYSNKTSNFTMDGTTAHTTTIMNCTGSMTTVAMVDAGSAGITNGTLYWVKNGKASGTITISGNGGQLIDGAATYVLNPGEGVLLSSITTGWISIGSKVSAGGASITADNGLNMSTSTNVQLGGSLLANTTISTGTYQLNLIGNPSSSILNVSNGGTWGIHVDSTEFLAVGILAEQHTNVGTPIQAVNFAGGNAIAASTVLGDCFHCSTTETGYAGKFTNTATATNTILTNVAFAKTQGSGAPANGSGLSVDFIMASNTSGSATSGEISNQFISKWTTAATATRTSEFSLTGVNSAVTNILLTVSGAGIFTLPQSLGNYANDAAAATGGVPVNALYRNGSIVMIRVS